MAKISVEVRSGAARFAVRVQAPTIQQALSIVATRFPGSVARVKSPIRQQRPRRGSAPGAGAHAWY